MNERYSMSDSDLVEFIETEAIDLLRSIHDPDIPLNIYDLGLIYRIDITPHGEIDVDMTFTNPNCPVADLLLAEVRSLLEEIPGVTSVQVHVVWDPPWTPDALTEAAKLELNLAALK